MVKTGRKRTRKRRQKGGKVDLQKAIEKMGIEFHIPSYNYAVPGTRLQRRLKRGDKRINRLHKIAMYHDIAYSKAKNLQEKWRADEEMIQSIDRLPGKKTLTEKAVKKIMKAKKRLKL